MVDFFCALIIFFISSYHPLLQAYVYCEYEYEVFVQ